jgi:RNA polymerase sigma-70 factor (ECF subfamily)
VVRAMAPLTPAQRAAVVLVDVLGLNSEEAGEALGIRPSTVRVLAARGRAALRETWGESYG